MGKITTILFDFDGVIVNTEPQYDVFSNQLALKYNLGNDFIDMCKGATFATVLSYFPNLSDKEKEELRKESDSFELMIDFIWIDGAKDFIQYLKDESYKVGLVTSSPQIKMSKALRELGLESTFDCIVTADRITEGKPHPMCYELGAKELSVSPSECLVFEDSIHGINAAKEAKMKVGAVASSFPEETLSKIADYVIKDFTEIEKLKSILEQ